MIAWDDVYKVVVAMVPLYFALFLGYGSVKWWKIIAPGESAVINRLVFYFTLPLFTIEFTTHIDPFNMNYRFIAADVISKVIVVVVLAFWGICSKKEGYFSWCLINFSLCTLTNTLVLGVPLMQAMYGQMAVDLVIQSSVFQSIVWFTIFLFILEFRRAGNNSGDMEEGHVTSASRPSFWHLMRVVGMKIAKNPNAYACIIGLAWAFVTKGWDFKTPNIIKGPILIMSKAGAGTAMFSMGTFMAIQQKLIACGPSLAAFGMLLKFIAGPAAMAIGSVAIGLRGDILRVSIIQAALPEAVTTFIFAQEYGLRADVLSTAVILGTIVSLPVMIAYYAILDIIH